MRKYLSACLYTRTQVCLQPRRRLYTGNSLISHTHTHTEFVVQTRDQRENPWQDNSKVCWELGQKKSTKVYSLEPFYLFHCKNDNCHITSSHQQLQVLFNFINVSHHSPLQEGASGLISGKVSSKWVKPNKKLSFKVSASEMTDEKNSPLKGLIFFLILAMMASLTSLLRTHWIPRFWKLRRIKTVRDWNSWLWWSKHTSSSSSSALLKKVSDKLGV